MTIKLNVRSVREIDIKDISVSFDGVKADLGWHNTTQCIDLADDLFVAIEDLIPRGTIVEMLSKYGYEVDK